MSYVIYLRKSRADTEAEARGEMETLARHERELKILAKRMQLNVSEIYREIKSGETIASRPVMQQLLSEVEQGIWDGVLVMEVERLARGDTIDQGIVSQAFKFSGTKIYTPSKTYDPNNEFDEEYFEFGLFMSRREYKTINRRLQRGRLASVKEGKYVGNKPPYGYKRVKLEGDKGFTLTIVDNEAEVVKMVYNWAVNGLETERKGEKYFNLLGYRAIARELNNLKIPAVYSDRWKPESVYGILTNPVYCGYVRWNGRKTVKKSVNGVITKSRPRNKDVDIYKGMHQPIISEELYKKANEIFIKRSTVRVDKELQNPIVGLVVCGQCGRNMFRRPYYNKIESKRRDSLICSTVQCRTVSSYLDIVENKILLFLADWLEKYKITLTSETVESPQDNIESKQVNIDACNTELLALQKQLDKTHDLFEKDIYSLEVFLSRSNALNEKINELKSIKAVLLESLENEKEHSRQKIEFIPTVESVLSTYHLTKDIETKNKLLKTVIEKVVYNKLERGIDNFTLDIFPRISGK